jgi:hypothetical protein
MKKKPSSISKLKKVKESTINSMRKSRTLRLRWPNIRNKSTKLKTNKLRPKLKDSMICLARPLRRSKDKLVSF